MGNYKDNNTINDHTGIAVQDGHVRIAYSLDNTQPVLCTLLSDQPFFYMDEEIIEEEDSILSEDMAEFFLNGQLAGSYDDGMDIDARIDINATSELNAEISDLCSKMESYDRLALDFTQPRDVRMQEFVADSVFVTQETSGLDTTNDAKRLEALRALLSQSRMAASLLACADHYEVELILSNQTSGAAYDKKAGKILIRPDIDPVNQFLLCVQELRRHWQHRQGALVHPLTFHPDQAVLINRAQLADLMVAVIHSAWELKLQGMDEFWTHIENSALYDLGRAFAREAHADFRTLNNGKAAAAVFETWFLSERCQHQDKKLIQAMLADYRGYVFENTESSRMISMELICSLGHQPFGKNYLAPYAGLILNDPVFTEVRDRANANFLWFIKFERSFSEAEQALGSDLEQELQSHDVIHTSGIDQMEHNNIIEDNQNAQPITAKDGNIIHIAFGQSPNNPGCELL
ncbi:MAG: hypothetical protein MRY79_00390 [Alphaproteobacteria bacterium]|nr:hypothetical protein [Alphaproteobacteria bacterium]